MIEVRKISNTQLNGVSLFLVFYKGSCKKVYARNEKEAIKSIEEKEENNMSANDVECPYCGADNEICHDDGYGYDEGVLHHQECGACGKTFAYETSISFYYEAFAAPCIDGDAEHDWKETGVFPRCFRQLRCSVCGEYKEIEGIEEERKAYLAELVKVKAP